MPGVNEALSTQLSGLLAMADATTVSSGLLLWFGSTDLPDGVSSNPVTMTGDAWTATYLRLMGGDLARRLLPLPKIQALAAQPGQPIPLVIASIVYDRPSRPAYDAVRACAPTDRAANLPATLAESLVPAETTIATALLAPQWLRSAPATRGRNVRLIIDPTLLITNVDDESITDVAVDWGEGFQPISAASPLDIGAPVEARELTLTVRCTVGSRGIRYARCTVAISDDPVPPAPDETWLLTPTTGNPGRAYLFRAGDGDRLSRPVLIAEGFPGRSSPQKLAETLGQFDLLDRLRANGHDVIAVSFDRGTDLIQSNAGVIREAIATTRSRTTDPLVVGGMSMGGLVVRYALAEMESEGVEHGAAVYLSIDSPHGRGAYTTVVGQWLVNHFTSLSPAYAGFAATIRTPANLQFIGLIEAGGRVAPDPLRSQFLGDLHRIGSYPTRPVKLAVACGHGGGNSASPPTEPVFRWRSDGIADITLAPMPVGASIEIARGATLGAPTAHPEPLVVSCDVCWETVPGALNVLNTQVFDVVRSIVGTDTSDGADISDGADASDIDGPIATTLGTSSSMPTVSALDLDINPNAPVPPPGSGASPFDDYVCAGSNLMHLELSADMVEWIVDRIERHQPLSPPLPTAAAADSRHHEEPP